MTLFKCVETAKKTHFWLSHGAFEAGVCVSCALPARLITKRKKKKILFEKHMSFLVRFVYVPMMVSMLKTLFKTVA